MNEHEPERDFLEFAQETRDALWTLRNSMPARPTGSGEGYQAPARFYLENLHQALGAIQQALEKAKTEIPPRLWRTLEQRVRQLGPHWADFAESEPEIRRFYQVSMLALFAETVIDDLANEGRPQPAPDLSVKKMRRSS